jgi:hypothetical protein
VSALGHGSLLGRRGRRARQKLNDSGQALRLWRSVWDERGRLGSGTVRAAVDDRLPVSICVPVGTAVAIDELVRAAIDVLVPLSTVLVSIRVPICIGNQERGGLLRRCRSHLPVLVCEWVFVGSGG